MAKYTRYKSYLAHKEEFDFTDANTYKEDIGDKLYTCKMLQHILSSTDWMITRHQEQILANVTPKLTDDELNTLIKNRVEARKALKFNMTPQVADDEDVTDDTD